MLRKPMKGRGPKRLLSALLAFLWPAIALAQTSVLQGGNYSAGHFPVYSNPTFSQPIVVDSGAASGGGPGVGINEFNQTNRGSSGQTSGGPFASTGTGPLATHNCMYDNPTSTGLYRYLCFDANAQGGGLIAYGAVGATALPFTFNVNGTSYAFPFAISGIVGPNSSTVGHIATWNNTTGTLLADGGAAIGTSGATIPLLNGNNTYSGTSTFTGASVFNGTSTFNGAMSLLGTVTTAPTGIGYSGSGSGITTLAASAAAGGTMTLPNATDTIVGRATTDTLTNKSLTSPALTGTPTTPTAAPGTSTTQVASTAFVTAAVATSAAAPAIRIQKFSANGTYTPDAHLIYAIIECVGGGAGGGGRANTGAAVIAGGGGGGSGGYARAAVSAASVGVSKAVTIGAGGGGGNTSGTAGAAGSTTSVGSLCVAAGGTGGDGNGVGGSGGAGSTGDYKITGAPGSSVPSLTGAAAGTAVGGVGGVSHLGAGGNGASSTTAADGGAAPANSGGGGGGGASSNAGGGANGGSGAAGSVVVTEFCSQ